MPLDERAPADRYVYHYTTASTALLYILPTGRLRLSSVRDLRDPLEAQRGIELGQNAATRMAFETNAETQRRGEAEVERLRASDLPPEEIDAAVQALGREMAASASDARWTGLQHGKLAFHLETALTSLAAQLRVLSVSIDHSVAGGDVPAVEARGFARPTMWDRYGDAHRGVCLCFDRVALDSAIARFLRQHQGMLRDSVHLDAPLVGPVDYSPTSGSRARHALAQDELGDHIDPFGPHDEPRQQALRYLVARPAILHAVYFNKLVDWQHEREFRWILHTPWLAEPAYVDFGTSLCAVIVGQAFDEAVRPALALSREARGFSTHQLTWQDQEPRLVLLT